MAVDYRGMLFAFGGTDRSGAMAALEGIQLRCAGAAEPALTWLDDATLVKYGVGFTTKRFFDEKLGGWREEDCATFPWVVEGDGGAPSIARVKLRSVEAKKNMRLEPAGGAWGLFGLHTVPDDCDEVVLCEGEYDEWVSCGE